MGKIQGFGGIERLPATGGNRPILSDAFNTFFKQLHNAHVVADVLRNISTGAIVVAAHLYLSIPTVPVAPIIACAVNQSTDPNQIAGAYPPNKNL